MCNHLVHMFEIIDILDLFYNIYGQYFFSSFWFLNQFFWFKPQICVQSLHMPTIKYLQMEVFSGVLMWIVSVVSPGAFRYVTFRAFFFFFCIRVRK